jgi:hypothetical protein
MENCRILLQEQIKFFKEHGSARVNWYGEPNTIAEEMMQLKYNACTEAYEDGAISRQDIIEYFGKKLYDEVACASFEREHNL